MTRARTVGAVTYAEAGEPYFRRRSLRRRAGVWSLWALGTSAALGGQVAGWNLGLDVAGIGGLLVALGIVGLMAAVLTSSVGELAAALPHTGGAYSFGRVALGPWLGLLAGAAQTIAFVARAAVIVVLIGSTMEALVRDVAGVDIPQPWWWLVFFAAVVLVNAAGTAMSFRLAVLACLLALGTLVVFLAGAAPAIDVDRWALSIAAEPGGSAWFPFGAAGVFLALPFAAWLMLGLDAAPLAAEESRAPRRDLPRAARATWVVVVVAAFLVVFLSASIAPGAEGLRTVPLPFVESLRAIFGTGASPALLGALAVVVLAASLHAFVFASARNIYALGRAGYYPRWLSLTSSRRRTPQLSLLAAGMLGCLLALTLYEAERHDWLGGDLAAGLVATAVLGVLLAYTLELAAFVLLRLRLPALARPVASRFGVSGALAATAVALATVVALLWRPEYRLGCLVVVAWLGAAAVYFQLVGRRRLALSPEEEFALTGGLRGDPERHGYGRLDRSWSAEDDDVGAVPRSLV